MSNMALAKYFAKRYKSHTTVELEDLEQAASEGLVIAADRFNPTEHQARFGTYASWWNRQRVLATIMNTGDTIRLPAYLHQRGEANKKRLQVARVDFTRLDYTVFLDPLESLVEAEERARFKALFCRLRPEERELLCWYISDYAGARNYRSPYPLSVRRSRAWAAKRLLARLRARLNPLEGSTDE